MSYQKYTKPSGPGVVGPSYHITDGLFLLLDDVPMTHPIPGYISLPVDRVKVIVLTQARNIRLCCSDTVTRIVRVPAEIPSGA